MQKLKTLGKYAPAITFLAFEFFALMAFNYSGSFVLFGVLSLVLTVLLVLFNIAEIKTKGFSNVALFYIPLFLFTLLTAFGAYSLAHAKVGDYSYAEVVFIPLGILAMAFCGYLLSIDQKFNLRTFLIVIYSGLALYCLINLTYNIINFGAFYPVIYKNYYLYYGGVRSSIPVNKFAYTLEGFKFIEVEMSHYVLYPLLLLTSSVMLMYLSPKKEKVMFILFSAFTFVALLCLVLIPSMSSLRGIIAILLLLLVIFFGKRYVKARTVFKWILIGFLILMLVGFVGYVLLHQSFMSGLASKIQSNSFLNKLLFTNGFVQKYNAIIDDVLTGDKILGFAVNILGPGLYEEVHLSGAFVFDTFMTSGVFGAIGLFVFLFLGFKAFKAYFKAHLDEFRLQATLLLFLVVFVVYTAFFSSGEYALYYSVHKPVYMTAPFMLTVFMLSYVYCKSKLAQNKEPQKMEEKQQEVQLDEKQN